MSWYIISFFGFIFTFSNIVLYFFKYSCTNIFHRRSLKTFYIGFGGLTVSSYIKHVMRITHLWFTAVLWIQRATHLFEYAIFLEHSHFKYTIYVTYYMAFLSSKMCEEIIYPLLNFSGYTVGIWEWISNFFSHFMMDAITYLCWVNPC